MFTKPESEERPTEQTETSGGRVVVLLLLGLVLLAGAGYAAAHQIAGDKVPRGTTVAGVKLGGHSQGEAAEVLEEGLAERASASLTLSVDGKERTVEPSQLGLSVDYQASVAEAGGSDSWSPSRLWNYFTGGDTLDAVVLVDDQALTSLLDQVESEDGKPPREGAVKFRNAGVKTVSPRSGEGLDREQARSAVVGAYLSADPRAELELVSIEPEIDESDVQAALDSFANQAVSEPVALTFDSSVVTLTPAQYTPALSLEPVDGALKPTLDQAKLAEIVQGSLAGDGAPVDASVAIVDGAPQVIPAKPGASFDQAQIDAAFLDLVAAPSGQRNMPVTATVARAEFTTKDAEALNIKEKVSTFSTYFPYAEYRNVNLGRAAELIDGTLLKPGETFSLNDTVGERTRKNGFTEGFIIANGIFKEDLGGGVSQMATTLFNAMFFAGLEDVEHRPHSFYIDRYPVGREATIVWGALDLRFKNDTEHGVLIEAKVTPSTPSSSGVVTVNMWSTKVWDIDTTTSDRYNFTPPETRTLRTDDCHPNQGYGGFQVDVKRFFKLPGQSKIERTEVFKTTYTPSDTVICETPSGDS